MPVLSKPKQARCRSPQSYSTYTDLGLTLHRILVIFLYICHVPLTSLVSINSLREYQETQAGMKQWMMMCLGTYKLTWMAVLDSLSQASPSRRGKTTPQDLVYSQSILTGANTKHWTSLELLCIQPRWPLTCPWTSHIRAGPFLLMQIMRGLDHRNTGRKIWGLPEEL
jgi:hypothetical protein